MKIIKEVNRAPHSGDRSHVPNQDRERMGRGRGGARTFPCAGRECTRIDEKVLAIVEQAHSCAKDGGRWRS